MTALDQLKTSVMNDKENQEKYNMERDRYQLMKYLKELRKAKGITQKELAQKMEYSQQGISKLEHYNSKDYYMEQNEIFKKQHPQGMVS